MSWALSTYLIRQSSLGARQLDQIVSAGFDSVEIYGDRGHFDYTNPSQIREIAQWANSSDGRINALHGPLSRNAQGTSPHSMVSIAFLDRQRRQDSMDEIKRALETAEHAPIKYLILHLGVDGEEFDLRKFDAAMTSLEHLGLFAGQRGVKILLENIANDLSSPRRLVQFFAHTHVRGVEVCLDTGHAQLDGRVVDAIELLGKSIRVVHLSDNHGNIDDHLLPPAGVVPWLEVMDALAEHCPQAVRTIEARGVEGGKPALDQACACRESLQELQSRS
jgi:sugar phosphate isomerase/epimerase